MAAIIGSALCAVYIALFSFTRIDGYVFPGNELALPRVSVPIGAPLPGTDISIDVSLPGVPTTGETPWVPGDRLNILVMGLDRRPWEPVDAPARSDTLFISSIDKKTGDVLLLAIPRDMWVDVPVTGEPGRWFKAKVTTAYSYGISRNYPGGGPQSAIDTIQHNFNVRIDHYIVVDWVGFVRLIDALGGIEIDVPATLSEFNTDVLDAFPNKTVRAGPQQMNGEQALGYSRTRVDGDLNRIARQQLVIRAATRKAMSLGFIANLPEVWAAYGDAIKTDVTTGLIPGYALLAQKLDLEGMETLSLGPATYGTISEDGQAILVPIFDQVYEILDEFLADPGVRAERPVVAIEFPPGAEESAQAAREHLATYGVPFAWIRLIEGDGASPGIYALGEGEYTPRKLTALFRLQLLNPDDRALTMTDVDVLIRLRDTVEFRTP